MSIECNPIVLCVKIRVRNVFSAQDIEVEGGLVRGKGQAGKQDEDLPLGVRVMVRQPLKQIGFLCDVGSLPPPWP